MLGLEVYTHYGSLQKVQINYNYAALVVTSLLMNLVSANTSNRPKELRC